MSGLVGLGLVKERLIAISANSGPHALSIKRVHKRDCLLIGMFIGSQTPPDEAPSL